MAVVEVNQLWESESGDDNIERKREYTLYFEVLTDNPGDDVTVACGPAARALGLPGNGYPYPLDSYSLCIGVNGQRSSEGPCRWIATCKYSTELPRDQARESAGFDPVTGDSKTTPTGLDPKNRPEHPLDREPKYEITHEKFTVPVTHTWQGIPILNCADEPYDPPIEISRSHAVITLEKNYAIAKRDWLDQFMDSVNATKWNGYRKRTCKIDAIDSVFKVENGVGFWKTTIRIIVNKDTWDKIEMERGWRYKKNVGGVWTRTAIPIQTDTAGRSSDQVPLLNGARASGATYATDDATPPNPNDGSNPAIPGVSYASAANDGTTGRGQVLTGQLPPVYTRWRVYPEKAFSLLGI